MNSQRSSGQYVAAANVEMFNNMNEHEQQEDDASRMGRGGIIDETAYMSGAQVGGLTPNINQYSNKIHSPSNNNNNNIEAHAQPPRIIFNGTQSPLKGTAIDAIL